MKGEYLPFNDGWGIVGFSYICPECEYVSQFTDCEEGCQECGFNEPYVDPDDWYEGQLKQ